MLLAPALMAMGACKGNETRESGSAGNTSSGVSFRTPPRVVGSWCGGTDKAPHWTYVFGGDGQYVRRNASGQGDSGMARFDSAQMTLIVDGRPVISYPWSMYSDPTLGDLLYIDGFSYVRGKCS
ncbi:hypothetical protein STAFG_6886 [Streptomyces afghaniensis 772]|uniref:Uncharacterized protein n=1 Tax=Streptomyces afghaniensis 772 TaxID=1283301 RepID=S4MKE4_9ACTN|nr:MULTISPECIES: hypothetical protein [Streptomyces]EPJ36065.1 hypothetical protein STAFG_6886 [Streptomyces afghaniensis 772]UOB13629.1 hypothetical protein MQE23_33260 [Streptomyces sp. HP-A2021]